MRKFICEISKSIIYLDFISYKSNPLYYFNKTNYHSVSYSRRYFSKGKYRKSIVLKVILNYYYLLYDYFYSKWKS